MRDMLFISHANPEDNQIAQWLALQLAREGYPVWCDLTKLLGGEDFWNDIQVALRERAIKFLFVLSRTSNTKSGPLNELHLATQVARKDQLKDFIIPLWVDDLPIEKFDIRIARIAAIRFQDGWANGLHQLLAKLEKDAIQNKDSFNPNAVSSWWREHVSASSAVTQQPEQLVTNWYPIRPATLYFHELNRAGPGPIELPSFLPYPGTRVDQYLVALAPADAFRDAMPPGLSIDSSATRIIGSSEEDQGPRLCSYFEQRRALANLFRQAWLALIAARGFARYDFANNAAAFYFRNQELPGNRAWFRDSTGARSWRAVVGHRTVKKADHAEGSMRYWHFALEGKPTMFPMLGFTMRPHVLFSDDGLTIWESKDRLHRARRAQCRQWWNDRWRDLIAASVAILADGGDSINLPVGPNYVLEVSHRPIMLSSPVSYLEPDEVVEHFILGDEEDSEVEGAPEDESS